MWRSKQLKNPQVQALDLNHWIQNEVKFARALGRASSRVAKKVEKSWLELPQSFMLFMNYPELPRAVQLQPQPELTLNYSFAASTRPETTRTFQPKETLKKPEVDWQCTYLADEKQMGEKLYICKAKSMPPTKSNGAIWPFCIAHVSNWHINFAKYIF